MWINEFLNFKKVPIFRFSDFFENVTAAKRNGGAHNPIRMIKNTFVTNNNIHDTDFVDKFEAIRFRFNDDNISNVHKNPNNNQYLTLKQKRYSLRNKLKTKERKELIPNLEDPITTSWTPYLKKNKTFNNDNLKLENEYRTFKKNKLRQEVFPVQLNRRLLRTRRTLVLPAHVNLTAITNSYDVVHSWFIPGLGLKFDCIPGRSTHHTFFVENVGFYYGQCAEICGRYHHHMPIRVCALPFEHFLVWWNSFGFTRLMYTDNRRNLVHNYGFRKYVW